MTKKEWFKNYIYNVASDTTLAIIYSLCLKYMPKEINEMSEEEKQHIRELMEDMEKQTTETKQF